MHHTNISGKNGAEGANFLYISAKNTHFFAILEHLRLVKLNLKIGLTADFFTV